MFRIDISLPTSGSKNKLRKETNVNFIARRAEFSACVIMVPCQYNLMTFVKNLKSIKVYGFETGRTLNASMLQTAVYF
jgi:hypothetical protein